MLRCNHERLTIDEPATLAALESFVTEQTYHHHHREGVVIGLSGGVDSALTAAICVRALGADQVLGMILPEKDSDPKSVPLARRLAKQLGMPTEEQDLTPILEAMGTYRIRDTIVERLLGAGASQGKWKLVLPQDLLVRDRFSYYLLKAVLPSGQERSARLNRDNLLAMVAATNIKQRTRMTILYHQAERSNRLVAGTTNQSELRTGFYVKFGDGGVDIEPLARLWKTQVYQLARYLELPREIIERPPSPDTYSGGATDQEFFFCVPYDQLDLLLHAQSLGVPADQVGQAIGLTGEQVQRAYRDLDAKQVAARRLDPSPAGGPEPVLASPVEQGP